MDIDHLIERYKKYIRTIKDFGGDLKIINIYVGIIEDLKDLKIKQDSKL
jgi:hypothetical protein